LLNFIRMSGLRSSAEETPENTHMTAEAESRRSGALWWRAMRV